MEEEEESQWLSNVSLALDFRERAEVLSSLIFAD
jgi:hypothetical protein